MMMEDDTGIRLTDRKRASIIEASVEEFQTRGFHSASMNRIAELAQVSKRTLYKHFESKESLFDAIFHELVARSESYPIPDFDPNKGLAEQLVKLGQSEIDFMNSASVQAMARAGLSRLLAEPEIAKQIDHNRFLNRVQRWIGQAKSAGQLKKIKDVEFAALQFVGLLKEFAFWPAIVKGEPPLTKPAKLRIVRETVEMFLARYQ
ncbi:TetR/AcrR family transcriptional regulator [Pirellulaceae bacterium SH449]